MMMTVILPMMIINLEDIFHLVSWTKKLRERGGVSFCLWDDRFLVGMRVFKGWEV